MTESRDYTIRRKKQEAFDKIAETLEKSEGLYPKFLALETGMKWSTIRNYLREMTKLGIVRQPYPRAPYYLVGKTPHDTEEPRVHSLRFGYTKASAPGSDRKDEISLYGGQLRLSITAHGSTGTVECQVHFEDKKSKKDLSLGEAVIIGDMFRFDIFKNTGVWPDYDDISVLTIEFNWDFSGVRLDSAQCLTLNVLNGFDKMYRKTAKTLRYEVRPPVKFGLKEIVGLMQGGAAFSTYIHTQAVIEDKIEKLQETVNKLGLARFDFERRSERHEIERKGFRRKPNMDQKDPGFERASRFEECEG